MTDPAVQQARLQGMAVALAEVMLSHSEPQIVADVIVNFGLSIEDFEAAGVEEDDLAVIRQCLAEASAA